MGVGKVIDTSMMIIALTNAQRTVKQILTAVQFLQMLVAKTQNMNILQAIFAGKEKMAPLANILHSAENSH